MMKVETEEETERNIKWWMTLAKSLRISIKYKFNIKKISAITGIYNSGFSFFTIQFFDMQYLDDILQVISELSFHPQVTWMYQCGDFYYINFRFKI
jgi:hypothetical protein